MNHFLPNSARRILFGGLIALLCCNSVLYAQERTLNGTVTDEDSNAIPGVNILVKGTTQGTISDVEGAFRLNVPDDAQTLVFSFVGYQTQEVALGTQATYDVQMITDAEQLSEVVVTGYTTQDKRDVTGAVSVVEIEDVQSFPVAGADEMLEGRVAGVNVISNNTPGASTAVRIRGFSTIRNNDPLYIIDGVPTTTGINLINPNDIESMQVLKDASSASIYGSRAANGVVIITTKKGKSETPAIRLRSYAGVQQAANLPRQLGAQEYGDLLWEASLNDGKTPASDVYGSGASPVIPTFLDAEQTIPSANTDWVKEIFEPALIQSHYLDFGKGSEQSHSFLSLGFFDQEGILQYTDFQRVTARINTDYTILDRVTIGENLSVAQSWQTQTGTNSVLGSVVYDAFRYPSIVPVKDNLGNFGGNPINDVQNPLGKLYRNRDNQQLTLRIFGNAYADVQLLDDLNFRTNFGLSYTNFNFRSFSPKYDEWLSQNNASSLSTRNELNTDWVWSNTLNYVKDIGQHTVDALIGIESVNSYRESFSASRVGFPYDDPNFQYLNGGDGAEQLNAGDALEWSLFSYFGKINYEFDQRYLLSFTFRRDGSSRLGNNKWGNFPAFSAGWRISEESFFNVPAITQLKLRVGYGQNGNQDIPPYSTISSFGSNPNYSNYAIGGGQSSVQQGFTETRNANPDLKWETTTQTNVGLDIALWENRLVGGVDYFYKRTEDLLVERPLPPVVGGTNQTLWDNVGAMENSGVEVFASYQDERSSDFSWHVDVNVAAIRNKLVELPEDIDFLGIPGSVLHSTNFDQEASRSDVGQPIASFYGHDAIGIFQTAEEVSNHAEQPGAQPGDLIFRDVNSDGKIDDEDRTFIGSPHPDFTYGITLGANFKAFDVSLFFFGSEGNQVYDLTRYYGDFFNLSAYNKSERTLNAWTPQNTGADVPRLSLDDNNRNARPSSYYVRDASFLKLKNFQIGYTLPRSISETLDLRVYVQAQNLFTLTPYEGMDPEVGLQNYGSDNRNLDIGVDRGIYPSSRSFTVGVNLGL
ncbi:MAG: TonB-dependent receptor [Cyclobacteriaceae bacterium]